MTAPSPRERLAEVLSTWRGNPPIGKAGVTARQYANAQLGRPVAVVPFLRICAAVGHDPCPDLPHPMIEPANFDPVLFGMAFKVARGLRGHSDRQAGAAIEASAATVCRIERGDSVFIGVLIRACRYVGVSPLGYCNPLKIKQAEKASRETVVNAA